MESTPRKRKPGADGTLAEDAVRAQLEKVLASRGFAQADRLSHFLRFIVEQTLQGKSDALDERVIGVEVYGLKPDSDPRSDPTVRQEAHKLRSRLRRYYAGSGRRDPIVIELHRGAYVPVLAPAGNRLSRRTLARMGGAGVLAVAAAAGVWVLRSARKPPRSIAVMPFL
ncbi:MAG: hypothetical protein HYR60_30185, partial [Acidobacteria bacterium]|nr:hypothetical protein [Acidobacteriota bacterium]